MSWQDQADTTLLQDPHIQAQASLQSLYDEVGQKYGLDPKFLKAWAMRESSENPANVNKASGAQGLMGWMPADAKARGINPFDPYQALDASASRLRTRLNSNGGDLNDALEEYYGGADKSNWGPLTKAYPGAVLANYNQPTAQAASYTPVSWQDEADSFYHSMPKPEPVPDQAPTPPPRPTNWTFGTEVGNAALFGKAPYLRSLLHGDPITMPNVNYWLARIAGAPQSEISAAESKGQMTPYINAKGNAVQAQAEADRAAYVANNPWAARGADVLGSSATTAPLLALGGEAIAPTAAWTGFKEAAPGLASLGKNAFQGAVSGFLNSGLEPQQSTSGQTLGGAATGAVLGPFANWLGRGLTSQITPRTAEVAQNLIKRGINIPLWQIPGPSGRAGVEAASTLNRLFGGQTISDVAPEQISQFNRDITRGFGEDTDNITPQLFEKTLGSPGNKGTIQTRLDNAATSAGYMPITPKLQQDLQSLRATITSNVVGDPLKVQDLNSMIDRIEQVANKNANVANPAPGLTGQDYSNLTSRNGLVGSPERDGETRFYKNQLKDILDDFVGTNAQNPAARSDFLAYREQWKNAKIAQSAFQSDSQAGSTGKINPKIFANVAAHGPTAGQYSTGNLGYYQPLVEGADLIAQVPKAPEPGTIDQLSQWASRNKLKAGAAGVGLLGAVADRFDPTFMGDAFHALTANPYEAGALLASPFAFKGLGALANLGVNNELSRNLILRASGRVPSLPFSLQPWLTNAATVNANSIFGEQPQ